MAAAGTRWGAGLVGSAARGEPAAAPAHAWCRCFWHRHSTSTDVAPRRSRGFRPTGSVGSRGASPWQELCKPPLVTRQLVLQGPPLWLFKFPFHEQMKHFILYDFPTMAVIPFHLSGTRDDGGRTRAPGHWQPALSMREHTFTFT